MKTTHTLFVLLLLLGFFITKNGISQNQRTYRIKQTNRAPVIDGKLTDPAWDAARATDSFKQMRPYNGEDATDKTLVKMVYDKNAIYLGVVLRAENHKINRKFTERDRERLTDHFVALIDPFHDGLNGFAFKVTTENVQIDVKYSNGRPDDNWDAVWESATRVHDKYWIAEMRIPFSELRFPAKKKQLWGINFLRNIEAKRELASWNYVNINKSGLVNQSGTLKGIKGIQPPMRLSFMPYVSSYLNKAADNKSLGYSIKGGTDLKYGINQSFTLDMMLIPDFGQVQEDDEVLNLSPFETYHNEKRQFFIEGRQMFNRAGVFYSRRIGGEPRLRNEVDAQLQEHESIVKNPEETQLINATKVTGKTRDGFGLGILNAMTLPVHAEVKDTLSGETRKIMTQGFANYNVSVAEQSLQNNSYLSIINTNKSIPGQGYSANTTGGEMEFRNNSNDYKIEGTGAVSQIYSPADSSAYGYYYDMEAGKISGNFQFEVGRRVENDTYNPNAMGFVRNNNEISNTARIAYHINEPFSKFLNLHTRLYMKHAQMQNPKKFRFLYFNWFSWMTFTNHLHFRYKVEYVPIERRNYTEARVENQVFVQPSYFSTEMRFSSDYRKTFALDGYTGYFEGNAYNQHRIWYGLAPRFQPNNKLTLVLNHRHSMQHNNIGYVTQSEHADTITFGKRDIPTIENTLNADLILDERSSLNFRLRHYWSQVSYDEFFRLLKNGRLRPADYSRNSDFSMNALNMQLKYNWNFAPGSRLSVVWKNQLYTSEERTYPNYFSNIESIWEHKANNSISVKLLYFIHYDDIKNLRNLI